MEIKQNLKRKTLIRQVSKQRPYKCPVYEKICLTYKRNIQAYKINIFYYKSNNSASLFTDIYITLFPFINNTKRLTHLPNLILQAI